MVIFEMRSSGEVVANDRYMMSHALHFCGGSKFWMHEIIVDTFFRKRILLSIWEIFR